MAHRTKAGKSERTHQKISVSFRPEQVKPMKARAKELGFSNSFSAYIQKLIDEDLARGGSGEGGPLHKPLPDDPTKRK